jgi:hypothetical protein
MVLQIFFWLLLFTLLACGWLVWSLVRRTLFSRRVERALRDFVRDRDALQDTFLRAAAATGKPRGLAWTQCDFHDGLLLARDRATGELTGLVGATIGFAAVEGGGMEDVEAVGKLRAATAVLTWKDGHWTTQGRAVFNLEPREVLERYRDSLDAI